MMPADAPAQPFPADPRTQPAAYLVRVPNVLPALFLDLGRALAYAAQHRGQLVPLYEGAP